MRKLLYIFSIISILSMAVFPNPAYAVTSNLTITGNGSDTSTGYQVPLGVAGGNFANLQSDDGDASVLWKSVGDYTCWTFSAAPTSTITSVKAYLNARTYSVALPDAEYVSAYALIGGVRYTLGFSPYPDDATYYLKSVTWSTNPSTGLAWTKSQIDATQFGYVLDSDNMGVGGGLVATYMYLVVDYAGTSPTVSTSTASPIGVTTATLNGSIVTTNGADVKSEGFVWDTTSHATLASNNVTPGNGYASWWYQNGTYGVGAFSHALTGLTSGQTYYYRATANNTYGWNYGSEVTFATIGIPTISIVAASYVSPTTAQLNANVVNSNGQACDVRFGYGTVSQPATATGFNAYTTRTAWVNNTYLTGNTPMVSIGSLTVGTIYYYNAQIENDAGISYGVEGTFTTTTGLYPPTAFIAIPNPTSIVLTWSKDPSSPLTYIKWSTSTFPNTTADGTLLYLGALSSTTVSNLTIGTNYYFSAWGSAGGLFSTNKITTLGTTTAGTSTVALTPPTVTTSMWVAMPSELGLVNFPLYSFFNWAFDSYSMPRATGYVILFMFLALIFGMIIYMKAPSNNLLLTGAGVGIVLIGGTLIGIPNHCLIPIWASAIYWIVFFTLTPVMNRY